MFPVSLSFLSFYLQTTPSLSPHPLLDLLLKGPVLIQPFSFNLLCCVVIPLFTGYTWVGHFKASRSSTLLPLISSDILSWSPLLYVDLYFSPLISYSMLISFVLLSSHFPWSPLLSTPLLSIHFDILFFICLKLFFAPLLISQNSNSLGNL